MYIKSEFLQWLDYLKKGKLCKRNSQHIFPETMMYSDAVTECNSAHLLNYNLGVLLDYILCLSQSRTF